ncbi:MAG: (p)ppGpp synthetase [Firmicutes bacterium]|nr:(p)ppGpp synthetase [Candidatus Caballimonas caccae]
MAVEQRVKEEKSLEGKLSRVEGKYQKLSDLTDILGARVICFFSDEVYKLGKAVEKEFVVDYANSADKSKLLDASSFGYLSLHYICSVKPEEGYPIEITNKKFEIQIRTNLQHTWAQIEHDLGYKSEFGVPTVVIRNFSRIAGMLELIDDEFCRTRDLMNNYTENVRQKIINNTADDVKIDMVSINEYVTKNTEMKKLIQRFLDINHAELDVVSAVPYIDQLAFFNIHTLGDLQNMMKQYGDLAFEIGKKPLEFSDIDILSSNIGLRCLCQAKLLNEYTEEQAVEFFKISTGNEKRAISQAKSLLKKRN